MNRHSILFRAGIFPLDAVLCHIQDTSFFAVGFIYICRRYNKCILSPTDRAEMFFSITITSIILFLVLGHIKHWRLFDAKSSSLNTCIIL